MPWNISKVAVFAAWYLYNAQWKVFCNTIWSRHKSNTLWQWILPRYAFTRGDRNMALFIVRIWAQIFRGPKLQTSGADGSLLWSCFRRGLFEGVSHWVLLECNYIFLMKHPRPAGASYNLGWHIYIYLFSGIIRGRQLDNMTAKERTLKTFKPQDNIWFSGCFRMFLIWVCFLNSLLATLSSSSRFDFCLFEHVLRWGNLGDQNLQDWRTLISVGAQSSTSWFTSSR